VDTLEKKDTGVETGRRSVLLGGVSAAAAAIVGVSAASAPGSALAQSELPHIHKGNTKMNFVTTKDGTEIFYKDWGSGKPVVFCHGWPLTGDAWNPQMMFLLQHGYRVIAHDRRGHGRSSQPNSGHEMDTYSDDLEAVLAALDVKDAMLVGHSTGGGEVARYIGRHGTKRVSKAVLIGAVPPIMIKSDSNPGGLPKSVFDDIRAGTMYHRSQFFKDLAVPFYGFNRPNAKIEQGLIDEFWFQGLEGAVNALYECIKVFSETDFTEDLKKITIPTMFIHGDDDQIVPIQDAAILANKLVKGSILNVYQGAPHGLCSTMPEKVNGDLLKFLQS
jgi:non-heme chloroperoxidase